MLWLALILGSLVACYYAARGRGDRTGWIRWPLWGAAAGMAAAAFRPTGQGRPAPPRPGRVEGFLAPPPGGRYTLDGQPLPLGEPFGSVLPPGPHVLELHASAAGGAPQRRTLEIASGASLPLFEVQGNPFEIEALPLSPQRGYPRGASVVQRADGSLLLARAENDDHGRAKIVFAGQDAAGHWGVPSDYPHNDVFETTQPALATDAEGTLWLAYLSQRADHLGSSGGYHLWLSSSRDGREWTRPRPVRTAAPRQYQESVHFRRLPDGRFLLLCGEEFAVGTSPAELRELDHWIAPLRGGNLPDSYFHSSPPLAGFDEQGQVHVLIDVQRTTQDPPRATNSHERRLLYTRSDDLRHWTPPVLVRTFDGSTTAGASSLSVRGGRVAIVYGDADHTWLWPGALVGQGLEMEAPLPIFFAGVALSELAGHGQERFLIAWNEGWLPSLLRASADEVFRERRGE